MPKRKRRNARNEKEKDKIRKRGEVYDAQSEAKNEERKVCCSTHDDSTEGVCSLLGEPLAKIQASQVEKMNSVML